MRSEVTMKHIESAVIGFWRMGANNYEIAGIMVMLESDISNIISDYEVFQYYNKKTNV